VFDTGSYTNIDNVICPIQNHFHNFCYATIHQFSTFVHAYSYPRQLTWRGAYAICIGFYPGELSEIGICMDKSGELMDIVSKITKIVEMILYETNIIMYFVYILAQEPVSNTEKK
jgi:hypothetical protein